MQYRRFLVAGVAATATYLALPYNAGTDVLYELIGLSGAAAIVVGSRSRTRRLPWLLMAAGQGLFVVGDSIWVLYERVLHIDP
jgi:hypothetical protein